MLMKSLFEMIFESKFELICLNRFPSVVVLHVIGMDIVQRNYGHNPSKKVIKLIINSLRAHKHVLSFKADRNYGFIVYLKPTNHDGALGLIHLLREEISTRLGKEFDNLIWLNAGIVQISKCCDTESIFVCKNEIINISNEFYQYYSRKFKYIVNAELRLDGELIFNTVS